MPRLKICSIGQIIYFDGNSHTGNFFPAWLILPAESDATDFCILATNTKKKGKKNECEPSPPNSLPRIYTGLPNSAWTFVHACYFR